MTADPDGYIRESEHPARIVFQDDKSASRWSDSGWNDTLLEGSQPLLFEIDSVFEAIELDGTGETPLLPCFGLVGCQSCKGCPVIIQQKWSPLARINRERHISIRKFR